LAEKDERWDPAELGPIVGALLAQAAPNADLFGVIPST